MSAMIELDNAEWSLIRDLFDPPGRRGRAATYPRPEVVEAILFLARTGCQWRYLPHRYPPWEAVWQQWRRWRDSGVWARAMTRLAQQIRVRHGRAAQPSMVMIDAQTVRGGRAGPTFHSAGGRGGRTIGIKSTIMVDILGLPFAVRADPAKPHDVRVGRESADWCHPAGVGVAYRITVSCAIPLALGATWWSFDEPHTWPPQKQIRVPGVITLKSEDEAVFRADIDSSLLTLTRLTGTPSLERCA